MLRAAAVAATRTACRAVGWRSLSVALPPPPAARAVAAARLAAPPLRALRDPPPFDLAPDERYHESQSDSEEAEGPHDREVERATAAAAAALARRPHARAELAAKLARRKFDPQAAAAALDRLHQLGLQDDSDFAASFARSKWRSAAWAPGRIGAELRARGVDAATAADAVAAVFGAADARLLAPREDGEGDDSDAAARAAGLDARLLDAARAQAARSRGAPRDARRRRLVGWLARRGHRWGTIAAVLARVEL